MPLRTFQKKLSSVLLVFLFVFGGLLGQLGTALPAKAYTAFPKENAFLLNPSPSVTTTVQFDYTADYPVVAGNVFSFYFPVSFGAASFGVATVVTCNDGGTYSAGSWDTLYGSYGFGYYLTTTRVSGASVPAGTPISCQIAAVVTPAALGTGYPFSVHRTMYGSLIDLSSYLSLVPGSLTSTNVQPASLVAGASGTTNVTFTTTNIIPLNGKIKVTFPSGYNLSGVVAAGGGTCSSAGGIGGSMDGTFIASVLGPVVTIARSAGTAKTAGAQTCKIYGVVNPQVSGSTGTYSIETMSSSNASIDKSTSVSADTITAGTLTSTNVEPATLSASASGIATASFTTVNPIPSNGKIKVTFPAGFDVSGASGGACSTIGGSIATAVSGQVVTLTRSGGSAESAAAETCTIGNIINPAAAGSTGVYAIETLTSGNVSIDINASVSADTIASSALTSTNVQPASIIVGSIGAVSVAFTTIASIPSDGKIKVTFPSGFDVSGASGGACSTIGGSITTSVSGQIVTLTRSGGSIESAAAETCTIQNIQNPYPAGSTGTYDIQTTTAGDTVINYNHAVTADNLTTGTLTGVDVQPATVFVNEDGIQTLTFTNTSPIPSTGRIIAAFPSQFTLLSNIIAAGGITCSNLDGVLATTVSGSSVTMTRSGGTLGPVGLHTCIIHGVHNGAVPTSNGSFVISTASIYGTIESGSATTESLRAQLTSTDVEPATLAPSASGMATINFTTGYAITSAVSTVIRVTFPSGFDISGASGGTCTLLGGSYTISTSGHSVLMSRVGGNTVASPASVVCTINNIVNPSASGSTGTYTVEVLGGGVTRQINSSVTADTITAGPLTSTNVEPASLSTSASGGATVSFTTTNPIPSNGKIKVTFPAGFDVSGASGATCGGTSVGTSASGSTVTLTLNGLAFASGSSASCTINNIVNPATAGSTGTYTIETTTAGNVSIDIDSSVTADTIVATELTSTNVQPYSLVAGAVGVATISFTTSNPIPSNGKIKVTFPNNFNVSSASGGACSTLNGSITTTISDHTITLTRIGGSSEPAGAQVCTINHIGNPVVTGATGVYGIETTTAGNVTIDIGSSASDNIGAGTISGNISLIIGVVNSDPVVAQDPIVSYAQGPIGAATNDTILLVEGSTKDVYVYGTVSDPNGSEDIVSVTIKFYSVGAGASCDVDNLDSCYSLTLTAAELNCQNQVSGMVCAYSGLFPLTHHTENAEFIAKVTVTDRASAISSPGYSSNQLVLGLLSINIAPSIDYGSLSVGDTGETFLPVANWGNVTADVKVQSEDLSCTAGSIPAEKVKFNGVTLANTDTSLPNYNLPKQTGATAGASATDTQMILGPLNSVRGACSGNLTVTALVN